MQLDLDPKQALHIDQAQRTTPSWRTKRRAEGWPPCAFGLENFTHLYVSHMAETVLVLQPGIRPEPLRWESRVQDIIPTETSQPHVISIGESSPRDLCLNAKTQLHSTTSKGFPGDTVVRSLLANAGDTGSSPGLGRFHMPRSD